MNADQLIHAVRQRCELWDPKHIGHNNRLLVSKLWQEVADEVGTDKVLAKSRWRGLRDYYRQEVRKQVAYNSDPNTTSEYRSSWALFDLMYFVKDTILTRRQRDMATIANGLDMKMDNDESYEDDPINVCIPKLEPQYELPDYLPEMSQDTPSPECQEQTITRRATKNSAMDLYNQGEHELKKRKIALLEKQAEENENDDLQFFKSLLPDLADLPRAKKSFIRLKIQEIIHKVVHNNEGIMYENNQHLMGNTMQNSL